MKTPRPDPEKPSPGTWEIDGNSIVAGGRWEVCASGDWGGIITPGNLRLIAAAPKLLDIARWAIILAQQVADAERIRAKPELRRALATVAQMRVAEWQKIITESGLK